MMGPPLGKCDKISVDRGSVIQMGQGDWAISGRFLPKAGAGRSAHTGPLQLSDLIKWFGEMAERPAAGAVNVRVDQRRGTATASKRCSLTGGRTRRARAERVCGRSGGWGSGTTRVDQRDCGVRHMCARTSAWIARETRVDQRGAITDCGYISVHNLLARVDQRIRSALTCTNASRRP